METSSSHNVGLQQFLALPADFVQERWYAAYTRTNHEKRVAGQLERRSVEQFLPLYETVRPWKDRRARVDVPLFPGYVFVRIALKDRLQVLEIPSVVRLVGFNGHPTPLLEEDIKAIRTCLVQRSRLGPHAYLTSGQRVRVLSGPLRDLTGIIVRRKNRTRLVISLHVIMRSVEVEIDTLDVEQID